MSTLSDKDIEELSLLLPWYANGTLDAEDSVRVEQALAEDDALAREFDAPPVRQNETTGHGLVSRMMSLPGPAPRLRGGCCDDCDLVACCCAGVV